MIVVKLNISKTEKSEKPDSWKMWKTAGCKQGSEDHIV